MKNTYEIKTLEQNWTCKPATRDYFITIEHSDGSFTTCESRRLYYKNTHSNYHSIDKEEIKQVLKELNSIIALMKNL